MSDPVLSQLASVETDLAQQVETLETQLSQLQEQRQGLRTVINMFQASNGETAVVSKPAPVEPIAEEPAPEEPVTEEPAIEESKPAAKKTGPRQQQRPSPDKSRKLTKPRHRARKKTAELLTGKNMFRLNIAIRPYLKR